MSKYSRDELIQEFIAALRASQTANETADYAVAEYLGIDASAYRCLDILDQEGPMTAGRLAEDRRRVLVEVAPELRKRAEELHGPPEDVGRALSGYTDDQLRFLIDFFRGSVAYQETLIQRLEEIKGRESEAAGA